MPIVRADRLTRIGAALLKAAGATEEEANAVAAGCVNANLAGHDSHGVIAIPTYIDRIKVGHIVPGANWTIVQETPTTTVIDGHWGFGFHVNAKAMALTIAKAKTANVAACTVFRQSHVGRLAAFPMMAMREGMIGLATADSGRSPKHVRPERSSLRLRAAKKFRPGGSSTATGGRPPTPNNSAKAARCCRSAVPKVTREAAWLPWSRFCADCLRAWDSASNRRDVTMTDASWRCSMSQRSAP